MERKKMTPYKNGFLKPPAPDKLVGCYIARADSHRIALHAILSSKTRSEVFQELLLPFIEKLPELEILLEQVTVYLVREWQDKCIKNASQIGWKSADQMSMRWNEYKEEIITEFKKKKLDQHLLQQIIQRLEILEYGEIPVKE